MSILRRNRGRTTAVRPPGRVSQLVIHATRRLEGHTLALGFAVAAVGALLAYIAWSSVNGVPFQDRYTVNAMVPEGAPIVTKGDAVRVAGQLAGLVTDVEPEDGATEIEMSLRPGFAPIGTDARATVRVKSIVYLTYVQLDPGNTDEPMPEGGTIPIQHAGSNVDLLEVVQLFDRRARETLQKSIYNAGVGLADRGTQLNAALADLDVVVTRGTDELEALTREPGALAEFVRGAAATTRGLTGVRPDDVGALIGSGGAVLATVAGRTDELGRSIDLLRPVNDEFLATAPLLNPVLTDAARLSSTLTPVVDELETALPDLNRTLEMGDELRVQTARLTGEMAPVIREAIPVLRALEPTVASVGPMLDSLRVLVSTLAPYDRDLTKGARGLIEATSVPFPGGQTAPNTPALRFSAVLTNEGCRDPFPKPNTTRERSC
jgi:ABC-type transporter Mla subunit MlaD